MTAPGFSSTPQVIVVGGGNWGKNLVRNFARLGALAGIAEPNLALRERLASEYPEALSFEGFDAALAHDTPALVLATPAPTHYELGRRALEAGKDVFIEKPLTLDKREAVQLTELAERDGRILMVGHLLLYQRAVAWIRDFLASPEAGVVRHVHTTRAKLGKARSAENVWWSFAPHDVSLVLEFLDYPELLDVSASGNELLQPGIADSVHADLVFAGGKSAHLHVSWYWPVNERRTTVITDRLMISYDEADQSVTIHDKHIDLDLMNQDRGIRVVEGIADQEPLLVECQHFLDCLRTRNAPRSDGRNGVAVVEILQRVEEALHG